MKTEPFSIPSTLCSPVGSEIEVYRRWVSTLLTAYKRTSYSLGCAESDHWRSSPLPRVTGPKGGVTVHSKQGSDRALTLFVYRDNRDSDPPPAFCLCCVSYMVNSINIGLYCKQPVASYLNYTSYVASYNCSIAVKHVKLIIASHGMHGHSKRIHAQNGLYICVLR